VRTRNPVGEHITTAAAPQLNGDVATVLPSTKPSRSPAASTPAAPKPLNENAVKALPVPETGNRIHYFPGAIIQGKEVPRGFGVRISAGGVRSFVMNYRIKLRERRYTIGQWPDWSVVNAV
jgi:hypothetical protein